MDFLNKAAQTLQKMDLNVDFNGKQMAGNPQAQAQSFPQPSQQSNNQPYIQQQQQPIQYGAPYQQQQQIIYQQPTQPIVYQQAPQPIVYQQAPQPIVYQQAPQPIVYQQAPQPIVYQQAPQPIVYQQAPQPIVYQQAPQPIMYQPPPQPVVYNPQQQVNSHPYPQQQAQLLPQSYNATPAAPQQPVVNGQSQIDRQQLHNDVQAIKTAMKGLGTDELALINVFGHRTPAQMAQIIIGYKSAFGKELHKDIASETSGEFGKLIYHLTYPLPEFEAECVHNAIAGAGTDEKVLIEVLVGRTNGEIRAIRDAYRTRYGKEMEADVKDDVNGKFKRLLIALMQGNRDEGGILNVDGDVELLYKAGEGKIGTDESTFIHVLASRSEAHLSAVFQAYQTRHQKSIEKVIKSEFSGNLEDSLLAIVRWVNNKYLYFAEQFEDSMSGMGTNDEKLMRLSCRLARDPAYGPGIKQAYVQRFGKTLFQRIEGETSGNYKKLLLMLVSN